MIICLIEYPDVSLIVMKAKSRILGLTLFSALFLQGCYTQLAMFYPDPEIQEEQEEFYETYSQAPSRPGLGVYAQDGAGTPLGMAYSSMYNRYHSAYGNYYGAYNYFDPYNFYNSRYGYGYTNLYGYGGYDYFIGGYRMFVPVSDNKELRSFNKDRTLSTGTNLNVNRSRTSSRNNESSYGNSSSVSSTRSSGSSSSSSSSSSSGGRRATRRN